MDGILSFIGMIIVAIIGLIGVILQVKSKEKTESIDSKIDNIKKEFTKKTDDFATELITFKEESTQSDKRISDQIQDVRMKVCKIFLVTELTKISQENYIPSEEQKRVLKDTKDEYNAAGGDSYVDDMYEDLRDKGLI
jgi:esterase/lipase